MERSDFETSTERARVAHSRTRVNGSVTKDFKWVTGRWCWWPDQTMVSCQVWNEHGGPALNGLQRRIYWLCMGWSKIEVFPVVDQVDTIQNGGRGDGGA